MKPRGSLAGVALATCLGWACAPAATDEVPPQLTVLPGVIVTEVPAGSAPAAAGLQRGDMLTGWSRATGAEPVSEDLKGPFDWCWLESEQAARGPLILHGERTETDGRTVPLALAVAPGAWGVKVRPSVPASELPATELPPNNAEASSWQRLAGRVHDENAALWLQWQGVRLLSPDRRITRLQQLVGTAAAARARSCLRDALARAQYSLGDLQGARTTFEADLAELDENETPLLVALRWYSLGHISMQRGETAPARDAYSRAHRIQEARAPHSLPLANTLNGLAYVAIRSGAPLEAEAHLLASLRLRLELAPESPGVAGTFNNLSSLAISRGHYSLAWDYLQRALELERRLVDRDSAFDVQLGSTLNNLGRVAYQRGDLPRARELLLEALEHKQAHATEPAESATTLLNLGDVALMDGDLEGAHAWYRRHRDAVSQETPLDRAVAVDNLALLALQGGDPETALRLHTQALRLREQSGTVDSSRQDAVGFDVVFSHFQIGTAAAAAGQPVLAEAAFRRALELQLRLEPATAQTAELYDALARLMLARGARAEAAESLRRGLQALEGQVDHLGGSHRLRARFRADFVEMYRARTRLLIELGEPEAAFDVHERSLGRSLLEMLGEREAGPALLARQPLTSSEVLAQLEAGTALLSFSVGEHESFLFLLQSRQEISVFRLGIGEAELAREVARYRELLQEALAIETSERGARRLAAAQAFGHRLFDRLLAAAAPSLEPAQRLLLLPDGPLHLLPFAALPLPKKLPTERVAETLVQWKPLHFALSATSYQEHRQLSTRSGSEAEDVDEGRRVPLVALAPDLRSSTNLPPLPGATSEVEALATLLPGAQTLLGSEASERQLRTWAPSARVLHLATHAVLEPALPAESALLLAPDPADRLDYRNNGGLQVWEVFEELQLDADLVVLSACQTALGEHVRGEGLVGMTRAFEVAGARAVLASLWTVADVATEVLMLQLYQGLLDGLPKDEALRRAQLALAEHYPPYFWAGFRLSGDPRAIHDWP